MDALDRLLHHAYGDTGGSRRCAMFLLSLWDGGRYKADLQDILYNDDVIFNDMLMVLRYLYEHNKQLDSLVSEAEIKPVIEGWGESFAVSGDG